MRPIGPGVRAWRKRWFLVVAGSRTGHPLWGEVYGGMTLAVFTCRGRPAALNRATLRRYGSRWDGSSLGGIFRRTVLRRLAPGVLRPQLMQTPSPRSGSPCVSSKSAAPAMARGRRDCRVIDPFRAVAAAAPTYSVACAGIPQSIQHPEIRAQYDFFDFRADRARSDSAGLHLSGRANPLSFSPDLPQAHFFCLVLFGSPPPANVPF